MRSCSLLEGKRAFVRFPVLVEGELEVVKAVKQKQFIENQNPSELMPEWQ